MLAWVAAIRESAGVPCTSQKLVPVLHTGGCYEDITCNLSGEEAWFWLLQKIKGTRVCEGGGTSPWTGSVLHAVGKSLQDLSDAAWNCGSQHLNGPKIYLPSVFLFLFCHIKTAILFLHLLTGVSYWVPERTLDRFSLPLIFYLLLVQNKDADIIHTEKFYKTKHPITTHPLRPRYNNRVQQQRTFCLSIQTWLNWTLHRPWYIYLIACV